MARGSRGAEDTYEPSAESLVQMRISQLNMIQAVIARLSGFSANAKNFCITILAALVAVGFQKPIPELVWAGVAVPLLFAMLDAYYLAQEKRFRALSEAISASPLTNAADMTIKPAALDLRTVIKSLSSVSVGAVYAALLIGVSLLLHFAGQAAADAPHTGGLRVALSWPSCTNEAIAPDKAESPQASGRIIPPPGPAKVTR